MSTIYFWSLVLLIMMMIGRIMHADQNFDSNQHVKLIGRKRSSRSTTSNDEYHYFDHVNWKDVLTSLIDVECSSDQMQIIFRYNVRHARLLGKRFHNVLRRISLSSVSSRPTNATQVADPIVESAANCSGKNDETTGQIALQVGYCSGCCGMRINRAADKRVTYSLSISLSIDNQTAEEMAIHRAVNEVYDLSCTKLPVSYPKVLGRVQIRLSEDVHGTKLYSEHGQVPLDKKVFVEGIVRSSDDCCRLVDLKSFPLNCHLSDDQGYSVAKQQRMFLQNGCPGMDDRGYGLSTVHHFKTGETRVGFQLVDFLVAPLLKKPNASFTVTCEMMMCSHSTLHGLYSIPKCPLTTYCSTQTKGLITPPFEVQSANIFHVKSHLVNANLEELQASRSAANMQSDGPSFKSSRIFSKPRCGESCREKARNKQSPLSLNSNDVFAANVHFVDGVSAKVAMLLALASFLCGTMITMLVWYLRKKDLRHDSQRTYEMNYLYPTHQHSTPENARLDSSGTRMLGTST